MAAKTSAEMQRARKMLEDSNGLASAHSVAKACNLTPGAITRSSWYKTFIVERPATVGESEAKARRLIVEQGYSAYAAAKVTGISQSTISRRAWYREHLERTTIK